mgnify:CR=1 FL=1
MKGFPLWGVLAMSGAFLTKGAYWHIITMPCGVCISTYTWNKARKTYFLTFILIGLSACILPSLWYIAAYRQGGDKFFKN